MAEIYIAKEKSEEPPEEIKERQNPLSAFVFNPAQVHFATQTPDEKIVLLLRQHWITNLPWLFFSLLFLFAPFLLRFFPLLSFLPDRYQLMAVILWYLLLIAFVWEQFLSWYFHAYIVTNQRLVDIDFYNLTYKQITEAKIARIQDTTLRLGGVIRALLNFGDVLIQTAGAEPNLEFEAVPNPERVVKVLQGLASQEERGGLAAKVR